jgi:hypothetical protein
MTDLSKTPTKGDYIETLLMPIRAGLVKAITDVDMNKPYIPQVTFSESKDIVKFFEDHIVKNCILKTWKDKFWGAWQVLKGNAGIIIYRIKKEDFYK